MAVTIRNAMIANILEVNRRLKDVRDNFGDMWNRTEHFPLLQNKMNDLSARIILLSDF